MSYLAEGTPLPEPNMDDAGFWENCARRRLAFQACGSCGMLRHPRRPSATGAGRPPWCGGKRRAAAVSIPTQWCITPRTTRFGRRFPMWSP